VLFISAEAGKGSFSARVTPTKARALGGTSTLLSSEFFSQVYTLNQLERVATAQKPDLVYIGVGFPSSE
jgi:hypothetical protein